VRFVDRFMGRVELATWVEAADVVMAPYTDLDRVASGTLSYAMGAGRAVISTPFAFAKERLTKGRGLIAPTASPEALSTAILRLLGDRKLRDAIGTRAYADTRDMVWSAIGTSYGRVFSRVMRPPAPPPSSLRRLAPSPH
jgi:glycosyltransferase involved in cell wall biosynthesis